MYVDCVVSLYVCMSHYRVQRMTASITFGSLRLHVWTVSETILQKSSCKFSTGLMLFILAGPNVSRGWSCSKLIINWKTNIVYEQFIHGNYIKYSRLSLSFWWSLFMWSSSWLVDEEDGASAAFLSHYYYKQEEEGWCCWLVGWQTEIKPIYPAFNRVLFATFLFACKR